MYKAALALCVIALVLFLGGFNDLAMLCTNIAIVHAVLATVKD